MIHESSPVKPASKQKQPINSVRYILRVRFGNEIYNRILCRRAACGAGATEGVFLRRRENGTALRRFSLRRGGTVTGWRIERGTWHEELDEAVARMISRASPLPPPPPDGAGDPVELAVPVRFSLR